MKESNFVNRCSTWQIALFALNNTSTNLYFFLTLYISYLATGLVGLGVAAVGMILTLMRIWDGITDPIIGYVVDKTNGRFGKNRPFILIGNVILFATSGVMFNYLHKLPESIPIRYAAFIGIYLVYIIGYTLQCVVTKSAQTCLTNDPKQRPTFTIFDSIYNTLLFTGIGLYVANYLVPKHSTEALNGFSNPAFFTEFWLTLASASFIFAICAIIGIWSKDCTKYYGTGEVVVIKFKDYAKILKENRAIQMLVVAASTDKLFTGLQGNAVVMVLLYGIVFGDYGLSGIVGALSTIPTMIIAVMGIKLIAQRSGQKKSLVYGTIGAMAANFLLLMMVIVWNPQGEAGLLQFSAIKVLGIPLIPVAHNFYSIAFVVLFILMKGFVAISGGIVIPMTADCADYETYRSGKYVPGLMGTLFSFVDKLVSSLSTLIIALMLAFIGFKDAQPNPDTPYSSDLFWVAIICFFAMPFIGWICNLIAMKFYPLDKEKMEEIQEEIIRIKEEKAKTA